jgi:NAD dependent epimerase/dehydratase
MCKDKNILITGADGFIGSHLTEMLLRKGHKVRALAFYNSFNNWGWLEDVEQSENLEVISGDIRDPFFCTEITKNIDQVFHLAALIGIPYSYVAPDSYIDTNIKGTLNICNAARINDVERIIHTSTSEVYGTAKYVPIDENHPLQPQSPYSASKIGADSMAMSFYNSFDLPLTIARPFNTYGPRQSARAVIPTIISQIASGEKEIKVGDLSPTRDFNYVEDTCRAFIKISEHNESIGETLNIGSNYEISIFETFEKIKNIMNSNVKFLKDPERIRPEKSEVERLWCDNTKLIDLTEFKPRVEFEEGLTRTIDWFMDDKNLKQYKPQIYNV